MIKELQPTTLAVSDYHLAGSILRVSSKFHARDPKLTLLSS